MSGGETGRLSSRDVAHEAEDTRAHLASTLEQLRTNLRPENVVDEVMSNARAGAASMADSLAGVAKANPLPSLLVAAGVFVVMGFMSRGRPGRKGDASPSMPRASMLEEHGSSSRTTGPSSSVGSARIDDEMARWRAERAVGDRDPESGAAEPVRATTESARGAMQSLSHYVPRDRREVASKLSNLLDDQPLILGAIGLAVGAAIGAALPITEAEDHLMGGPSHQLRRAATDAARNEVEGLRSAATEAVDNMKKAAVDHGLSTDNLNGLVKDVGSEARAAINKVGTSHGA